MGANEKLAALGCLTLVAVALLPARASAAPRERAPRIFLPFRAALLPDPLTAAPDGRGRTVHAPSPPPPRDIFGWLVARTEFRPARAIIDFRPMPRSSLRLSLGTRFYAAYGTDLTSPDAEVALHFNPRGNSRGTSLHEGFQRFAPIALVGYDRAIGGGWRAGVDAGAMLGRAVSVFPYVDRPSGRPGEQTPVDPFNPVGAVTLTYDF